MALLGTALNIGLNALTFVDDRKKGKGVVSSVASIGFQLAAFDFLPEVAGALMAKDVLVGGFKVANEIGKQNANATYKSYKANFGGYYQDTQGAATMRQRGLQAIQNNGLNNRSVLGSEARTFFRGGY